MVGLGQLRVGRTHLLGQQHRRPAVDVQPDPLLVEVAEPHANVRVLQQVPRTRHHTVAPVIRIRERALAEHPHESRRAGPEAAVAAPDAIRGGNPDHLHAADECLHAGRQDGGNLIP
jgi:hypothetical protein